MGCVAPSDFLTEPIATLFGHLAEVPIMKDYLKSVGRSKIFPASLKDYWDYTAGFSNRTLYLAFLKANHPKLDDKELDQLLGTKELLKIPDLMTYDPSKRTEFYEIKPNSASGLREGRKKIGSISAMMQYLKLPYVAGTQYTPDERKKIVSGDIGLAHLEVFFHFKWIQAGLIVYDLCAEGDLDKLTLPVLLTILSLIVSGLLKRPPLLPPKSFPVPRPPPVLLPNPFFEPHPIVTSPPAADVPIELIPILLLI